MGYFPFGQAPSPAPAGPGSARKLSELHSSSASGYEYSWAVRDSGKIYPGRLVFHPSGVGLFSVSARKAPEGWIKLYEVEGPGVGKWKDVKIDAFRDGYRIVDEDEGIAIRNLAPANVHEGDGRVTSIKYLTTLLSGVVLAVGDAFPTASGVDPAKLGEQRQRMLEGTLLGVVLATEAIDMAGAAYDSLGIGKNALNMIRHTAAQMLSYLNEILKLIATSTDVESIRSAVSLADVFMSNAPLWGLYINRAYLWTQSTDLAEMTRFIRDARQVDGAMVAVLDAIERKRDYLLKNGITPEQMAEAKAYAETILKNAAEKDEAADASIKAYTSRVKSSERGLERAAFIVDKYLDINAKNIKDLIEKRPSADKSTLSGLAGYFIGILGQPRTRRVLPEAVDAAAVGRAAMTAAIKSGRTAPEFLRVQGSGALSEFLKIAHGPMNSLVKAYDGIRELRHKGAKIEEITPSMIIEPMKEIYEQTKVGYEKTKAEYAKAETALREEIATGSSSNPETVKKVSDLQKKAEAQREKIAELEVALRVALIDSSLLEPNHIINYKEVRNDLDATVKDLVNKAHAKEAMNRASRYLTSLFMNQNSRKYILAGGLENAEARQKLVKALIDFQGAFGLPSGVMNEIAYQIARGAFPTTATEAKDFPTKRISREEANNIFELIRNDAAVLYEAKYNQLKNLVGDEAAKDIRGMVESQETALIGNAIEELRDPPDRSRFSSFRPEVRIDIAKYLAREGEFPRLRRFIDTLEGNILWNKLVIEELSRDFKQAVGATTPKPPAKVKEILRRVKAIKLRQEELRKEIEKGFAEAGVLRDKKPDGWEARAKLIDQEIEKQRKELLARADELNPLLVEAKRETSRLVDAWKYARTLSALVKYDKDIRRRLAKAEAVLSDPNASPETKAAAQELKNAVNRQDPNIINSVVDIVVGDPIPIPPSVLTPEPGAPPPPPVSDPAATVEGEAKKEEAAKNAEEQLDRATTADNLVGSAGGSGRPPDDLIVDNWENNEEPPGPENPARQLATSQGATQVGSKTKLTKTLYGLGATVAILGLIGLGGLLGRSEVPDPKSPDPIIPPPASDVEKALKIGGIVAGGALLLYLLFGRKNGDEKAATKPAKPVATRLKK